MAKLNLTSVKKENSSPHAAIDVIKWDTALMSGSGRIMISKDNTTSFSEYTIKSFCERKNRSF